MIRTVAAVVGGLSLLTCVAVPVLYFQGALDAASFKGIFAAASLGWFAAAITWATRRKGV